MPTFAFDSPAAAIAASKAALATAGMEDVPLSDAVGRVLAVAPALDRDSPACDLSAMDGYAVQTAELPAGGEGIAVIGEAAAGFPPPPHVAGTAVRIFTGAPLSGGCDRVIRQEDVRFEEGPGGVDRITPLAGWDAAKEAGANVRRRGENGRADDPLAEPGVVVTAALVAAVAACGIDRLTVRRRVRVAILVTGSEVREPGGDPAIPRLPPWQIRDANGPAVAALLGRRPYLDVSEPIYVGDDPAALGRAFAGLLDCHDAVMTTGGVSVGDHDAVPDAVRALGGTTLFHGLPIRPGKPVFAAAFGTSDRGGRLALGLPGNPVAALCVARRIGVELLRHVAGCAGEEPTLLVDMTPTDGRPLPLWRFWPVLLRTEGGTTTAEALAGRGASDTVALARSDGFVEVPLHEPMAGRYPFRAW
ncbi:molybdopterin molybdotransferase MoeA [Alienimonas chondri]|uniref:Molybdopterin molybdenumtransferase n=1 Tax=Alienimonas chondri TaxID=2681879 RepID=A0ABX1VF50_9PLAN|nr:molybdopterin molybdotransferase MoeA [Alienimonas chondri]NNJ26621.1 hypothetical protein [Alienimonas chondri]